MNNENLRTLSPNEARENGKKGGIKSGQIRKERKALKEQLLMMLENGNIQESICLALLDKAQNGDIKAFEVIRDTIGEKPVEKTENKITSDKPNLFVEIPDENKENMSAATSLIVNDLIKRHRHNIVIIDQEEKKAVEAHIDAVINGG